MGDGSKKSKVNFLPQVVELEDSLGKMIVMALLSFIFMGFKKKNFHKTNHFPFIT